MLLRGILSPPSKNKSFSFSLPYKGRARERWEGGWGVRFLVVNPCSM
jgi:hypothetical protein